MKKNYIIKLRVSTAELERIRHNAEIRGFDSVSQYLRFLGKKQDDEIYSMIYAMHRRVVNEKAR